MNTPVRIDKMLVPVDFSTHSQRAVEYAVALAERLGGVPIDILHVAQGPVEYLPLDAWIWGQDGSSHKMDDEARQTAQAALDTFVEAMPEPLRNKVTPTLRLARAPSQVIIEASKNGDYDLIVMGTRGRTGAKHILLGSVAQRVIRQSGCPVLTVR